MITITPNSQLYLHHYNYNCITTIIIVTSNKIHFKEINSYVGMAIVKKEQGQDEYFNQQSIHLTLPAYISATDYR